MAMISREQAEAIIAEQVIRDIFQDTPKGSTFLSMARRLPNMTSNQSRMRVLDNLPFAYWVNGDTGFKQTSQQAWDNVYINAEELAVIIPIPEAVLNDAEFDIFGQVSPRVREAIYQKIDLAAIFDYDRPAGWRLGIVPSALQAGNNVTQTADLFADLLGVSGVWDKVESAGYNVSGVIAKPGFKAKLRALRDDVERPIFISNMQGATPYGLDGLPLFIPTNDGFDATMADLVVGDWSKAVYSIRQDITVKILDQAVIQNPSTGEIIYNLPQQDMIALRVILRMGWALPNPATRLDPDRISCPFAYLATSTPFTTYNVTVNCKDAEAANIEDVAVEIGDVRLMTDASGNAVFKLQPGTYAITARKQGYVTTSGSATVTSSTVSVNLTVPAKS